MITSLPINSMLDRMATLSRAMDEAFQKEGTVGTSRTTYWVPALDAWETEHAFVVAVDLPGVNAEQVEVAFEKNTLTISGTREQQLKAPEAGELRVFFAERAVGAFSRSLRFPQYVEGDKIAAKFDRGVLMVTVPKAEAAKPRKITVGVPVAAQS
ncbi:MAG: Hsp20/alpha crystallin family protein [Gemmatimonadaceae bacterium]